jgi:hypothetical protein
MNQCSKLPESEDAQRRSFLFGAAAAGLTRLAGVLGLAATAPVSGADEPPAKAQGPAWRVDGVYAEACSCDAMCPCVLAAAPTQGYCQVLIAWHIDRGSFGEVRLDGFNSMLAVYSPGHILKGGWKVALYVDERASPPQRDALAGIFSGKAGGPLAGLAPLIAEVLGVQPASIGFAADGKRRAFSVAGVAEAEVVGIDGQGGKPVLIQDPPVSVVVGVQSVLARSTRATYSDHGLSWNQSDKNGFFSAFTYAST